MLNIFNLLSKWVNFVRVGAFLTDQQSVPVKTTPQITDPLWNIAEYLSTKFLFDKSQLLLPKSSFAVKLYFDVICDFCDDEDEDVLYQQAVDAVMDKFGEDVSLTDRGDGAAQLEISVQISPAFLAWCCAFGDKLKVVYPQTVVASVKKYIANLMKTYDINN